MGASAGAFTSDTQWRIGTMGATTINTYGTAQIWARATSAVGGVSLRRQFKAEYTDGTLGLSQGTWTDTTTNITSFVIKTIQTDGIGAGSTFSLYKLP